MSLSAAEVHRRLLAGYPDVLAGRPEEMLALIHPDVIDHRGGSSGDHYGKDAWHAKWAALASPDTTYTDLRAIVDQNVSSADISVNRYTTRGTHVATGRRYEVYGLDMIRVQDGQVIEHWALRDTDGIRHQLSL